MLTVACSKTKVLWVLTTSSKRAPVQIIPFIIIKLKNEQHTCKRVIVEKYVSLQKSTYVTNLLVENFNISMETTGGDALWINGKNEIQNISIDNMVIEGLLDSNQYENK